jgi:hypothetical protein
VFSFVNKTFRRNEIL